MVSDSFSSRVNQRITTNTLDLLFLSLWQPSLLEACQSLGGYSCHTNRSLTHACLRKQMLLPSLYPYVPATRDFRHN